MSNKMMKTGLHMRGEVLGHEHVKKSLAAASDFARPMQELVTQYCWGEAWGDDTLNKKTRSIINIAMLSALGRTHEIKLHTKGAINNGVSVQEIQSTLMQAMVYCGVPAGMEAFRAAEETLTELGEI
ncbi:MAG: 4-carboxymuconolactone decarboxylase [Rhodospirillaceae bacterium]|nr:4-carboxymuconolactone decarboxylase [Rhodospirillaceae bacterium]OUT80250.1 MAG: 4-carboxymuconolactone decarboxylase [Rhodospirillaceae bacterium TMED23]|tara:strand:- start:494 stop:874 length:381 start_codon:yes stop_codon:yes gene_type:complete